jgi:nucleoid DNA-binding protein
MERTSVRTITKKELSERIADKLGEKRTLVKDILQSILQDIVDELAQGNRIEFRDFGVFEVKTRAPRTAQNPRTLERVRVPERRSVKFKPGSEMREKVEHVDDQSPLPEPKTGVRPDTRGLGDHLEKPQSLDGQAVRRA